MNTCELAHFEADNNYYVATAATDTLAPKLTESLSVDTAIIGGGFAGLGTAMSLMERGQTSIALIEAQRLGFGASGRNGGFVFGGYSLGEEHLLKKLGEAKAKHLYGLTQQAIHTIKKRIQTHAIDCNAVYAGVILANWFKESARLKAKQSTLEALGNHWSWLDQSELRQAIQTQRYFNGLFEKNAFHFHPLKYAQGLAHTLKQSGVALFEHSPALQILPDDHGVTIKTPQGEIRAEQAVITCGGYMGSFYQSLSRCILPISTYVVVTEPLPEQLDTLIPTQAAIYDTRFAFDYYRKLPDQRLLWGGRISILPRERSAIAALLAKDIAKVFPDLKNCRIDYAWGGLMGYPLHKMPLIGQSHPRVWYNLGYGGHGVGPTTAGGELIAQALTGESNQSLSSLSQFPPKPVFGPLGQLGSQMTYWAYEAADTWRALFQK